MSDKSRDVEPDHEEIVPGDPDATPEEDVTPDELVDQPDELAAAEEAVSDPELRSDAPFEGVGDHADAEARDETREDDDLVDALDDDGDYDYHEDNVVEDRAADDVFIDDEVADAEPADDDYVAEAEITDDELDERIDELEGDFTPEEQQAAVAAGAPAIARKTSKAPVRKKDAPTRRRSAAVAEHDDPYKASNPAEFVQQSAGELKKVVWPTWPQLVTMFFAVLIFVVIIITIVALLDLAFGWALLQLFGN